MQFADGETTAADADFMTSSATVPIETRRYEGAQALAEIAPSLREAGLLRATIAEMDPEFLAECTGTGVPGVVVAFQGRPIGYIAYRRALTAFPFRIGPFAFSGPRVKRLQIMGCETLVEDEAVVDALLETLTRERDWHLLRVFALPLEDALARHLLSRRSWGKLWCVNEIPQTWEIGIDGTFDDYVNRRFGAKARYNLRRELRLLEAAAPGHVSVRVYCREDQVDEFLERAQQVAITTYQWRLGLPKIEATPVLRRRLTGLARRGLWRSYILYIREVPAAFCYATIRYGALEYEIIGHDPRFRSVAPGKVLLYRIVEDLFATRIVDQLSFGMGPADYKRLFATASSHVLNGCVYNEIWSARLLAVTDVVLDTAWDWLRDRFPSLHVRLKRWFRTDRGDSQRLANVGDLPVRERYRRVVETAATPDRLAAPAKDPVAASAKSRIDMPEAH